MANCPVHIKSRSDLLVAAGQYSVTALDHRRQGPDHSDHRDHPDHPYPPRSIIFSDKNIKFLFNFFSNNWRNYQKLQMNLHNLKKNGVISPKKGQNHNISALFAKSSVHFCIDFTRA